MWQFWVEMDCFVVVVYFDHVQSAAGLMQVFMHLCSMCEQKFRLVLHVTIA